VKASIITPAYNCIEMLKQTLASLELQELGTEYFEVIVIDDGSNDGTAEFLKKYNGKLNLVPVINEKNLGRAKSRNKGIAAAKNDLIIFLDADVEVKPDYINILIKEHSKGVRACVGKVIFHPKLKIDKYTKYLDERGSAKMKAGEKLPGKYFRTTNASVPKKLLVDIGCFDENFIHYGGEDTEIGMRIADKTAIYYLPEAIGYNRHARTLDESLEIIRTYGEHSLPYLIKKRPELKADILREGKFYSPLLPLICSKPSFFIFKFLANIGITTAFIYNFLLLCSYREGFRKSR
jgi:glycosyltransferase involved in cell wall biosynthesis